MPLGFGKFTISHPAISTRVIKEFYVVPVNKLKADPPGHKNIIHNRRLDHKSLFYGGTETLYIEGITVLPFSLTCMFLQPKRYA